MGIEVLIIGLQLRIIRRVQCIDLFVLWLDKLGCYLLVLFTYNRASNTSYDTEG